jgi:hypothetical protein
MHKCMNWLVFLLILVMPISIVSAYLAAASPYIGVICRVDQNNREHCVLYTKEYEAIARFRANGIYEELQEKYSNGTGEPVFIMMLANDSLIRLIFYCRNGQVLNLTTRQMDLPGYGFCPTLPFTDGTRLVASGLMVLPSQWRPELTSPRLFFVGDLYVYEVSSP